MAVRISSRLFGRQRLVRADVSPLARLAFRALGVVDPAHYLHSRYIWQALRRHLSTPPPQVLDAGCGRGDHAIFLADNLPTSEILGVDFDGARISANREILPRLGLSNLTFAEADLATMSAEGHYDLIISIDVLEHIAEQERAIVNLCLALTANGVLVAHIPCKRERPVPFSRLLEEFHEWSEQEHIADERTAEEFEEVFARSGFEVLETTKTFGWWTGELATSLFAIPYRNSALNRIAQLLLALPCRLLASLDHLRLDGPRYAVLIVARRKASGQNTA